MASADAVLASKFGVSKCVVAALRAQHLSCPQDWEKNGNCIIYTPSGLTKLEELLEAPKKMEGGGRGGIVLRPVSLPIQRIFPSRIWVRVRAPDGKGQDVQVRDNTRLRERTQLLCVEIGQRWHCASASQASPQVLALLKEPMTAPAESRQNHTPPHP